MVKIFTPEYFNRIDQINKNKMKKSEKKNFTAAA